MKKVIIVFLFAIFLVNFSAFSQTNMNEQKMNKYGDTLELKMNEKVYFDDSLSIILTNFSHKHPYTGGPTKATAYLSMSKDTLAEDITISVHGVSGKDEDNDGLSETNRYDTIQWQEYTIQLKKFDYDKSIEIIVLRNINNK